MLMFVVVFQSICHVQFFVTPWTTVCQASLSFTISWSLLKLMSFESVMPSNHLIFCRSLLLLSISQHQGLSQCVSYSHQVAKILELRHLSFQRFSSVTQLCLTLCNPMDCSMPGFPVHHQLPDLAQTHVL